MLAILAARFCSSYSACVWR